jgi:hypothetical protein
MISLAERRINDAQLRNQMMPLSAEALAAKHYSYSTRKNEVANSRTDLRQNPP